MDIKDSFRNMFLDGDYHRNANARGMGMRFVDRSKIANNTASDISKSKQNGNYNHSRTFSIINVNDIIRDTDALLKF